MILRDARRSDMMESNWVALAVPGPVLRRSSMAWVWTASGAGSLRLSQRGLFLNCRVRMLDSECWRPGGQRV